MSTLSDFVPEELIDLGLVLGILSPANGQPVSVNPDWFRHPDVELKGILDDTDRRQALVDLATGLLGTVTEHLDLPDIDEAAETWIPIATTGSGPTTGGAFVIIDTRGDPIVSIGGRVAVTHDTLTASMTVRVPLVSAAGNMTLLPGTDEGDIEVAVNATVDGLGVEGLIELEGISLVALLPTDGDDASLSIILKNLLLPGDAAPADVPLGELLDEIGPTSIQILVALLRSQKTLPPELDHLLALIGFDPTSPIPELPLADLIANGVPALRAWVAEVTARALDEWMGRLAAFLGIPAVSGSGTTADPYAICLDDPPVHLCFTLATGLDPQTSAVTLVPGASLSIDAPAASPVGGKLEVAIEFCRLVLDQNLTVGSGPAFRALGQLGTGSLIDTTVDTFAVSVGSLRAGLSFQTGGQLQPVVEAVDVDVGSDTYAVLDLTSSDAVTEAAANALDQVIADLLDSLGIDDNPEAKALAVLAGLVEPDGAPVGWPSTVSLPALFTDPLGAIGCYHVDVLEVPGRWQHVAQHLALLLRSATSVPATITGTGTAVDPWTATLFDNVASTDDVRGTVDLVAWTTTEAGAPRLHLGLRTSPAVSVSGLDLSGSFRSELLRVELPAAAACPAPVSLLWAPTHAVTIEARSPTVVAGPVTVSADVVVGGVELDRQTGLNPTLRVTNPQLTIDGTGFSLPDLDLASLPGLDDISWPAIQLLIGDWLDTFEVELLGELTALFGWRPGDPLDFSFPQLPDLDLDLPDLPALDLEGLFTDPFGAVRDWLAGLFTGSGDGLQFPAFLVALGRWASALGGALGELVAVRGSGTYDDPWAVSINGGPVELLVWLDPDGPNLGGITGIVEHLLPGDGSTLDDLVLLLDRAAGFVPALADELGDTSSLSTAIADLRTRLEGDGLVTASSQVPDGWERIDLTPAAHFSEPAQFTMPADVTIPPERRIFVSSAALTGTAPWPGEDAATVIDLTEPGIRPESIDLSGVTGGTGWVVKLPARADAVVAAEPGVTGEERLKQRLRRAVDHIHGIVGGDLALIGHSTAGQIARLVGADGAGETHVTNVITLGTPHAGASFEFFDRLDTGEPLRSLQRLRRMLDEAAAATAEVAPITDLLDTITKALDPYAATIEGALEFRPFPSADFLVPDSYPDLGAGTTGHAVVGSIAPDLDAALVAFFEKVLEAAIGLVPSGGTVTHVGFGVRARLVEPDTNPGDLAVAVTARADLHQVEVAAGPVSHQVPHVSVDLTLRRNGGWLVGGPDPTHPTGAPRDPRARWLEAHLDADPTNLDDASLRILVHDVSVFGTARDQWVIDDSSIEADTLLPEARIILGEIASKLGPLTTGSPVDLLANLLVELGLAEIADGLLGFITDAIERLLADPAGEIRTRFASHAAAIEAAIAGLISGTVDADRWSIPLGTGFQIQFPRAADPHRIALEFTEVPLAGIVSVSGEVEVTDTGTVSLDLRAGTSEPVGPLGGIHLTLSASTADGVTLSLASDNDADLPSLIDAPIPLPPTPDDLTRLLDLVVRAIAGELIRRLAVFTRHQVDTARQTALDLVLETAGLLRSDGDVRNLVGVLTRPLDWLAGPTALGTADSIPGTTAGAARLSATKVRTLILAVRDLLELPVTGPSLPLPWGASLVIGGSEGTVDFRVGWDAPVGVPDVELDGALTLTVGPGFDVGAAIETSVTVTGTGLDHARLDLTVGGEVGLAVAIQPAGSAEIAITFLPEIGGLSELSAGGAVRALLPLALDAVAAQPDIGPALAALGDHLGLRDAGGFLADQLQLLAANPAAELLSRIHADAAGVIGAIGSLLDPVSSAVSVIGTRVEIAPATGIEIALDVPNLTDLTFCIDLTELRPISGLRLDVELCVDAGGLESLAISAEIDDEDLLSAAGVSLFPRVAFLLGSAAGTGGERAEIGMWVEAPAINPRHGIFVLMPFGSDSSVVCRTQTGGADSDSADLSACLTAMVGIWATPLAAELVLAVEDVKSYLDADLANFSATLGELLTAAGILTQDGPDWHLADGFFDELFDRVISLAIEVTGALTSELPLGPIELGLAPVDDGGRKRFGVTVGLGSDLVLNPGNEIQVSVTAADTTAAPVTLFVFSTDASFGDVRFDPAVSVTAVGIKVDSGTGGKLIDSIAGLSALELLGSLEIDDDGVQAGGVELGFIDLTVPVGIAGGGNPVASKILSQQNEDSDSGDPEELAPALSPRLELTLAPAVAVGLRLDAGDGPWWIPIQQAFGPIYVEQVGADIEEDAAGELDAVLILLDGGVSLAGLTVGVDDLSLRIPRDHATDLSKWSIDLQGLAVGYSGSGVTLAGGLRKSETPAGVEYVGLVQVDAMGFGISAIGAYGEFDDPAAPGTTYTSLFVFAALSAPLGGPPFFFVTGIGGGIGLNRELVLPADVVDIPGFPLVAAMDASSGFATDPMGALQDVSTAFPGSRGTFWFAAGVRFTSFVLLETVAVLAVEVGDDVEVALLGLSQAALPDPSFPIANIELALIARFSTAEGVLWVQAQLTDNSWILNEDCRLTGGFAFVVWFLKNEFVFTIGGYHPRFAAPDYYPTVPRLGFNWNVSGALVIKGENYFALTSSCVMAGAKIEASYTTSTVWASLSAGVDGLVSWDPFFYDVEAYVRVSAGIKIRVCFFACATISLSFSIGARLRVWGPKLKGSATLELGPVEVTVTFGASPQPEIQTIGWPAFVQKYLVQENPAGESMSLTVMKGLLAPDPGVESDPDDGSATKPWRVVPEFTIRFETRAASQTVTYPGASTFRSVTVDLGPVAVANVGSTFEITVTEVGGAKLASGFELVSQLVSKLPDGPWKYVGRESRAPEAGTIEALTGAVLKAVLRFEDGDIVVSLDLTDPSSKDHPLPFIEEQSRRPNFLIDVQKSIEFIQNQPTVTTEVLTKASTAIDGLSTAAVRTFSSDRVSPPRLAPLTEGMVDQIKDPVGTAAVVIPEPPPGPDTSTHPPVVMGVLRGGLAAEPQAPAATTVRAGADVPRVTAPTLATVRLPGGGFPRARLEVGSATVATSRGTVVPRDHATVTKTAVSGREFRGGYRATPEVAQRLRTIERRLLNGGHTVAPGDVVLLKLPNARLDLTEIRPNLEVAGDQLTRVVVLDRAGAPLAERYLTEGEVDLPIGAERIAVCGLGAPRTGVGGRAGAGLAGWHAQTNVHQVASNTYLAGEAIIRSAANRTRRNGSAVSVSTRTARAAVAGRSVTTHLPQDTTVVLVGLSPTAPVANPADGFTSISLGLFGADRRQQPDGSVVKPQIVIAGDEVYGIFAVEPNDEGGTWVTVSVESDERWNVVAVGGASGRPDSLVDDLREFPPDRLFGRGADPAGSSRVRFAAATNPPPTEKTRRKTPR